jgi:hypothetical protein
MKITKELILLLIIAGLLIFNMFTMNTVKTDVKKYEDKITLLSKVEDLALQKRVHHEIIHSFKYRNLNLLIKNLGLRIAISWRKKFKKYPN